MGKTSAHFAAQNKLSRFQVRRNWDQTEFYTDASITSFYKPHFSKVNFKF